MEIPKDPVRCLKQPAIDRGGVCQFRFLFAPCYTRNSVWGYHTDKGVEPYKLQWDGKIESLYSGCSDNSTTGGLCTALIEQNGWHFPKDYPRKIRY